RVLRSKRILYFQYSQRSRALSPAYESGIKFTIVITLAIVKMNNTNRNIDSSSSNDLKKLF
ncbi:MAG: hypothetical protein J6P43_06440, partial [Succinivibrionaceae bacterium]|nr:hypothetical protein [Succinivibrionaceae bacterium]